MNCRPSGLPRVARLFLTIVAVSCATRAQAALPNLEGWKLFRADDGAFEISMPIPPTTERKERWFPMADFVSTVHRAQVEDDLFGMNYTDLPRVALWFTSNNGIFEGARDGFIEDSNATEVSFEETEYAGHKARELVYDIPAMDGKPPLRGRAMMFFEGKRLYIVYAEVTQAVSPAQIDHYFGSLRLD